MISFPADRSGRTDVDVTALFQSVQVGHAAGSQSLIAGGTATLALDFDQNTPADGGTDGPPALLDHFAVTATTLTIDEHAPLAVHLSARDANDHPLASYHRTPTFTTDWGDVTLAGAVQFANGEADVAVTFDRETSPAHSAAHLTVSDGGASGTSQDLTITAPTWKLDSAAAVFTGNHTASAWDYNIDNPVWMRVAGQYDLFYRGQPYNGGVSSGGIGFATSADGNTWTRRSTSTPAFGVSPGGWDVGQTVNRFRVAFNPAANHFFAVLANESQSSASKTILQGLYDAKNQPTAPVGVIKEGSVYKIWYTEDSWTTTLYATSSDGQSWVPSPSGSIPFGIETVLWNEQSGGYEALESIDTGNGLGFARLSRR